MPERGYECACQLLDLPAAKRPTAIFTCNDVTALNVYRAARQRRLSLPADLSVVGFDNVTRHNTCTRAPRTISQPFDMIARKAVDMILDARAGSVADHYLILPTRLVVRESSTAPKKSLPVARRRQPPRPAFAATSPICVSRG